MSVPASGIRWLRAWRTAASIGLGAIALWIGADLVRQHRVRRAQEVVAHAFDRGQALQACDARRAEVGAVGLDDSLAVIRATTVLEEEALRTPDDASVRHAAMGRLVLGHWDRAVSLLESLTRSGVASPPTWNAAAAAYQYRADATDSTESLVRALDAAYRAATLAAQTPAYWQNLARVAVRLHLASLAHEAFTKAGDQTCIRELRLPAVTFEDRYRDAERSLESLATVRQPALSATVTERSVLRMWAESVTAAGRTDPQMRQWLNVLLNNLAATTGDLQWMALRQLVATDRPQRLAAATLAYLDAVLAMDEERFGDVPASVGVASALVTGRDHPLWEWLSLERAARLRQEGKAEEAEQVLGQTLTASRARGFLRIQGRALWQLGLLSEERGELGDALARYGRAEPLLEQGQDNESLAVVRVRLARTFDQLNERARAWKLMIRSLEDLPFARRYRRDAIYRGAAVMADALGLPGAALAFQDGALKDALAESSAGGLAFLYPDRARNLEALGLHAAAVQAMTEGRRWLQSLADTGAREMAAAVQYRTSGTLYSTADPARALTAYDDALAIYRARQNHVFVPELQLGRARALRKQGDLPAAHAALLDGVNAAESRRRSLPDRDDGVRLAGLAWSLYSELADVQLEMGHPEDALATLQQGRVWPQSGSQPEALRDRLPGEVALTFGVLTSGVIGKVWTSVGSRTFEIDLRASTIVGLVAAYRTALLARDQTARLDAGRRLWRALFDPVAAELREATTLTIVPDPVLAPLPFATLPVDDSGRPLADVTPVLLALSPAGQADPSPLFSPRVVVVGDPESSSSLELTRLLGAREEARNVAALYGESTVLIGTAATKAAFMRAVPHAAVVHFGGHAIADERDPTLSRLVVSPGDDDPLGMLFERDISALDFSAAKIVVLAACDTARQGQSAGPAVFGFARAFLDAGADSVVATQWPIGDRASQALFVQLHTSLRSGTPVAEALRAAQSALWRTGSDPVEWGGVVVVGENARIVDR